MMYDMVPVGELIPDESNPRHPDPARLHLLSLSLSKLGFLMPVYATPDNLLLSGHQRLTVAKQLGFEEIPVEYVHLSEKDIKGINILFNRITNDFGALDTGSRAMERLDLNKIVGMADDLEDQDLESEWFVHNARVQDITQYGREAADQYDKKAIVAAATMLRKGIRIPAVVTDVGSVVNGVHRLLCALENGIREWPIIVIPHQLGEFALHFLNYLSMDYSVNEEFADVLRYSAYRRPQNNRGSVPKAYRFWANGERTLPDKDSYSRNYWTTFRELHGHTVCDFGAGLCKVAPFLETKGIDCHDFEPYRIDPHAEAKRPSPAYSKQKAEEFLRGIDGAEFNSIFLASVLNSIPFPRDRMCVLAIVHALSGLRTVTYGTCRDISDAHYEYGGIRQASYFMFDSEPNVRLGDSLHNPKIQKFHSQDELKSLTRHFWKTTDTWPGGNVFYFRCRNPVRVNPKVLREALLFEFHDLPYSDGTTMGLGYLAIEVFNNRLGLNMEMP